MVSILDKNFETFIETGEIEGKIRVLADQINSEIKGKEVLFVAVLNGAFMFAADLYREIEGNTKISFVKVSSYNGMSSTGQVDELIGLNENIEGKDIVLIEDIVDSGVTIDKLVGLLKNDGAKSVKVCTLLFKPDAFKGNTAPDYIGFSIPNKFVVGLKHVSTGDLFRFHMGNDTELGQLAKSYINKGQLVPDQVTINMLKNVVVENGDAKGFIFDGFPRTNDQAVALDELLAELNTSISVMLALEVEENELKTRLLGRAKTSGRADDADPKIIANRIEVYNKETAPVKDFYQKQNKFVEIDGIGSMDEITARLTKAIDSL